MKLTRKVVISLLMLVYAGSVFAQQQNVNKKQNNEEETSVET